MAWRAAFGVDYSGAKLAGRTAWLAECRPARGGRLRLVALDPLGRLAGADDRDSVNRELVARIAASRGALWALNFPFGLPAEALPAGQSTRAAQFKHLQTWGERAYECGVACVHRALAGGHAMHVRRATDRHHRTPFDSYHYRIIYQTFYGMRDVLGPLKRVPGVCVLPFDRPRLAGAAAAVVESCPSVTLALLGLPARLYKQPTGGPLAPVRRRTRRAILDGLARRVELGPTFDRRLMRDPGADGLDAVISALGVWRLRKALGERLPEARARREGWHYA